MKRRLYVILPDLASAIQVANELLLARVEDRHMHFLGRRGSSLSELHEASFVQKTDVRQALFLGVGLGVIGGMLLGLYLKLNPIGVHEFGVGTMMLCVLGGAVFGGWAATLVGVSTPNSHLKPFEKEIEEGKILLMVDIPVQRVAEIESLIATRHPQAVGKGIDKTMPVFP